jgi:NAD(P)-dependent dehydrogenase (short-subunit alcohol dehydrogenase family)
MAVQKVALVVGATSEIGAAAATELAARGWKVYAASRGGTEVAGTVPLPLDVCSDISVQAGVARVVAEAGRIDALVNLAGILLEGALEEVSIEEARGVMETNLFGAFRLVQAVVPLMRGQGSGNIVNVSALSGMVGVPFMSILSASRFGVEGALEALSHEVRPFGIHVCLVQIMGQVRTKSTDRSLRVAKTRLPEYAAVRERVAVAFRSTKGAAEPDAIGRAVADLAEASSPPLRKRVGPNAVMLPFMKWLLPGPLFRRIIAKALLG